MRPFIFLSLLLLFAMSLPAMAQDPFNTFGQGGNFGSFGDENTTNPSQQKRSTWGRDTSKVDKVIPTDYFQWRIDERLGTIQPLAFNDTLPHLFQNFNATEGFRGEYNILGNLGSPRLHRNFLDREQIEDFMFLQPYDYFHTTPSNLLFSNCKSPLTQLQYHECGTRENGQDRVLAYFTSNIDKQSALGFKIDYLYARGYYNNQANSQFGGTVFGYHRGEKYEMHAFASWEHMKMAENGGIESDLYITDPESFPRSVASKDIPTILSSVWNRNDQQTYFLTHRVNLGFDRDIEVPDSLKPKMPEDGELLKRIKSDSLLTVIRADSLRLSLTLDSLRQKWQSEQITPQEFVPVTSIFHTAQFKSLTHDNYAQNNGIPSTYFSHDPYLRSSYTDFTDETQAISLRNTLGIQLREGFNRWAKAGVTLFATHDYQRFKLPSALSSDTLDLFDRYTQNNVSVGGEISKTQGHTLHYRGGAEFCLLGEKAGELDVHGTADLNFRLFRDTVHLAANAYFKRKEPSFSCYHYHSAAHFWDNDLNKETRTRIEGLFSIDRTRTTFRFGVENITDYTHFANVLTPNYATNGTTINSYSRDVRVQQTSDIQVMSATLRQDLAAGIFHFDNEVTWQTTSNADALPLPTLSLYSNAYIIFHVAKVLRVELGADMRYFTSYYAPDYAPFLGQFSIQDPSQERIKIGNYPILNGYVNLAIKRVRMYVNVQHFNQSDGRAFWAPHYPIDPFAIHLGISWNFYN